MAQGAHAAQQIEKTPAHTPEGNELSLTGSSRGVPQQNHEQRHQRRGKQQQGCRQPAVPGGGQQYHQWHYHHQLALHLITADIAIQRIHLFQHLAGQLCIRAQGPTCRPQGRQPPQQQIAQFAPGLPTGTLAKTLTGKLQDRA